MVNSLTFQNNHCGVDWQLGVDVKVEWTAIIQHFSAFMDKGFTICLSFTHADGGGTAIQGVGLAIKSSSVKPNNLWGKMSNNSSAK